MKKWLVVYESEHWKPLYVAVHAVDRATARRIAKECVPGLVKIDRIEEMEEN